MVDYVSDWQSETGLPLVFFIKGLGIWKGKYFNWCRRYGKENFHNGKIPRDYWVEDWEKQAVKDYYLKHRQEGYRSVAYRLLDLSIVAVSPTTVWRILSEAGLLQKWNGKASKKGTGFKQPLSAHEHWHVDISYLNICGTFYYMVLVLDGYSRYVIHWDIRESMTESDIELVLQKARELFPKATPRIISDNGPQFLAKEFKEFIRISGMTHVRTSPYYPQSNGKLERLNQTIKKECIRPKTPVSLEDAQRIVKQFVEYYNTERLHSAIGYITPKDKLEGRAQAIFDLRDQKLEAARSQRKVNREALRLAV